MLMPKKVKYRKQQRGRMRGKAWRGSDVSFGDYGLKAMEPCWLTDRQIEAARVAMTRFIKRGGKIWIRVFPDKPITKKPQETRMGKGKGAPEEWVCVVRPGRILFEMEGVNEADARSGDAAGGGEAADQDQVRDAVRRGEGVMKVAEIRDLRRRRVCSSARRTRDDQLFRLRIQKSMGQLEAGTRCRPLRRDLARVKTVLREKERRTSMARKEITGVVVSDKMDKSVVVAVERQIRARAVRQDAEAHVDVPRAQRGERREDRRPRRHRRERVR